MLALTRNLGESIRIGDDITVTIVRVSGVRVRLGIEAPAYVPVHREEVYQAVQAEMKAAAEVPQPSWPTSISTAKPHRQKPHRQLKGGL